MIDPPFLELEVHERHRRGSESLGPKRTSRFHLVSVGKGFSFYQFIGAYTIPTSSLFTIP